MGKEVLYQIGSKDSKMTIREDGSMKLEGASITIKEPSQIDRLEKKMDSILELLENKETSTSFSLDAETLNKVTQDLDKRYNENLKRCGLT